MALLLIVSAKGITFSVSKQFEKSGRLSISELVFVIFFNRKNKAHLP